MGRVVWHGSRHRVLQTLRASSMCRCTLLAQCEHSMQSVHFPQKSKKFVNMVHPVHLVHQLVHPKHG